MTPLSFRYDFLLATMIYLAIAVDLPVLSQQGNVFENLGSELRNMRRSDPVLDTEVE